MKWRAKFSCTKFSSEIVLNCFQEHAKEVTKIRQEFDQNAKELQQKSDRKVTTPTCIELSSFMSKTCW